MRIDTRYLGDMDIKYEDIIEFKNGLPGFEDRKEFILLNLDENHMIKVLQDVKDANLGFLLVNPWDFFEDYDIEIDDSILNIDSKKNLEELKTEIEIYSIITLGENLQSSTCNLLAPIVINNLKKEGRQIILSGFPYTTKHKLFLEEEGIC